VLLGKTKLDSLESSQAPSEVEQDAAAISGDVALQRFDLLFGHKEYFLTKVLISALPGLTNLDPFDNQYRFKRDCTDSAT
jgi:hypothetical protein